MNDEQTLSLLRQILTELKVEERRIRPESRLTADLGLDSLDVAVAVISLEERLGIDLGDELQQARTLADVIDVVRVKMDSGDSRSP